jgi:hypothetical protein
MLKAVKDTWQNAFERTLDNAERASVRDFTNYYKTETDKAIGVMLQKNSISEQDLLGIFTLDGFGKLYEGLYERIGMTFANWYSKNFDKYITKGVSANQFQEPWRASFRNQGILVGAQRVTLVQNTAKTTLIKVYRQLANDPVFTSEGEVVKAKMLRQQFDRYSKYQAERLVRTEATNAANYATMQSAQDIFPGADMQKEWISASDERTRAAHREANGQIVDFNKPFIVKGEELMRPGDPKGSASNVVNCRCSMAPFPKEAAQTIGLIEDIGFGLNTTLTDETLMSLSPGTQAAVNTIIVEEVAEQTIKTPKTLKEVVAVNPNVPKNIVDLIEEDSGLNLELFSHFKSPQKLVIKNVRANHQAGIVTTNKYTTVYQTNKVYIHESGHFIADSRKWIIRGIVNNDVAVKPLEKTFEKWAKYANSKTKMPRLYKELDSLKPFETYETLGKQLGYKNQADYWDDIGSVKDTFGALTKEKIGGGHGKSYYKQKNSQWHEFIAHAYENKFTGNKVFKKFYPELYDDMIKMIDELNLNY